MAGLRDYHVHYFADGCAQPEMTLDNIEREAARLGFDAVCVLKHYSHTLPNGQAAWVHWKRIVPGQFDAFLRDIRAYRPAAGLRMFAGVETELVDDAGAINIPAEEAARLDAAILSVHWLPRMGTATPDPSLIPGRLADSPGEAVASWREAMESAGAEAILANFVSAYVRAIERNPGVRVLGHMYDGLLPLRAYEVPVDELTDDCLTDLMKPLMIACAERGVLWELTPAPVERPAILRRADALGVRFCATADAHFLQTPGWANLYDHAKAEAVIDEFGLTRGELTRE